MQFSACGISMNTVGGSQRVLCNVHTAATARDAGYRSTGRAGGGVTLTCTEAMRGGRPPTFEVRCDAQSRLVDGMAYQVSPRVLRDARSQRTHEHFGGSGCRIEAADGNRLIDRERVIADPDGEAVPTHVCGDDGRRS